MMQKNIAKEYSCAFAVVCHEYSLEFSVVPVMP